MNVLEHPSLSLSSHCHPNTLTPNSPDAIISTNFYQMNFCICDYSKINNHVFLPALVPTLSFLSYANTEDTILVHISLFKFHLPPFAWEIELRCSGVIQIRLYADLIQFLPHSLPFLSFTFYYNNVNGVIFPGQTIVFTGNTYPIYSIAYILCPCTLHFLETLF